MRFISLIIGEGSVSVVVARSRKRIEGWLLFLSQTGAAAHQRDLMLGKD